MGIKNCVECGKICVENPTGLCPECIEMEDDAEHRIGEFLRDAGTATIDEIREATGVKERTILRMMKRGRVFASGQIAYPCETCGAMITEGRLCNKCSSGFLRQVQNTRKESSAVDRDGLRMYSREHDEPRRK